MKTLILSLFLAIAAASFAQTKSVPTSTLTHTVVPEIVKMTFAKEFPGVQAKWEADDKNYKAVYADPKTNSKGIIVYDPEGKVIHRDTEVGNPVNPQ